MNDEFHWYEKLDQDDDYWIETAKLDFATAMERMMLQSDLTKTALAMRLQSSPAHITKVLRGDANLTIATMVKFARAAGGTMHIHIAPQTRTVRWFEKIEGEGGKSVAQQPVKSAEAWQQFVKARRPQHGQVPVPA